MTKGRATAAVAGLAAVVLFFLVMLLNEQMRLGDGGLLESVVIYAAIAVPGALLAAWITRRGRS